MKKPITGGLFLSEELARIHKGTLCLVRVYPLTPRISVATEGGVAPDCMDSALKASFP